MAPEITLDDADDRLVVRIGPMTILVKRQDEGVSVYATGQDGADIGEAWWTFAEAEIPEEDEAPAPSVPAELQDFAVTFSRRRWEHATTTISALSIKEALAEAKGLADTDDAEDLEWDLGDTEGEMEVEVSDGVGTLLRD